MLKDVEGIVDKVDDVRDYDVPMCYSVLRQFTVLR